MLCSKKMILPSKFNAKLQKKIRGGGPRSRSGGYVFFSVGGGGRGSTAYQHPVAMYGFWPYSLKIPPSPMASVCSLILNIFIDNDAGKCVRLSAFR
jgi:hypothetical protein